MCFRVNSKYPHVAQCVKSRVFNKAIYSILSIETFEQQCVVIKCMLQSLRLGDLMKTIGIDQSSLNMYAFEHRYTNNTKKIYQHAGKCDDQQNFKDIIESALLSTPEDSHITVLMCILHQHYSRNQVLGNHCVYSQT